MLSPGAPYIILPFRFMRFPKHKLLLVNEASEFLFLKSEEFEKLISYSLDLQSDIYRDLKAKHFLVDSEASLAPVIDLMATKYRTKKSFLKNFTSLHMVVVTLRCNHRCDYCHASSKDIDDRQWDMNTESSRKVVEMIFQTPSPSIKIEFQGGEPLLNFEIVKEIIEFAKKINKKKHKSLSFVLCTNLSLITKDILNFLKKHDVLISTSLDGPRDIHDMHRILRKGRSSYDIFAEKLGLASAILGTDKVSALVTITKDSIHELTRVIDEYVRLGFRGIFLRAMNPYGRARTAGKVLNYEVKEFVDAYKNALKYIIELNLRGLWIVEHFAQILLTRILTPFSTGFMDLQSPAGAGILGTVYDYNGDVYPTDEARMLAAMGDQQFYMGNVKKNTHEEIFTGELMKRIIKNSCVETIPGCHSCAYQQFCGADPIRAYSCQADATFMGYMPTSEFCKKHKAIISFLMELIEEADDGVMDVFWSWITNRQLSEFQIK